MNLKGILFRERQTDIKGDILFDSIYMIFGKIQDYRKKSALNILWRTNVEAEAPILWPPVAKS